MERVFSQDPPQGILDHKMARNLDQNMTAFDRLVLSIEVERLLQTFASMENIADIPWKSLRYRHDLENLGQGSDTRDQGWVGYPLAAEGHSLQLHLE